VDAQAGLDPCWSQTHYVVYVMTRLILPFILQVMEACNGRAYLPSYTPVGIFQTENYIDTMQGGTVGIFLGCLGDAGFKVME
jgi:hypothetical protein